MRKPVARFTTRLLLSASLLTALGWPRPGHAQAAAADRIQNEVFDDDLLTAGLAEPDGARVFGSHLPPARVQLIRPRTHFLLELLKSIEHL